MKQYTSEKLSIKISEKWFDQLPKCSFPKEAQLQDIILALTSEGENYIDSETRLYQQIKENKRDKDFLWVKRILQSGTLSDKISAFSLLIQEAPAYNIKHIDTLINMVNTKGKRECLMAIDALQELFVNYLLADERKLKKFNEQPLKELDSLSKNSPVLRKRILMLWLFEQTIKNLYHKFVNNLKDVSFDTVEKTKQKAINIMCNLLKENPEQEQFLLETLVNKIGDSMPKIGSHACYLLGQLLAQHPVMKEVVVQEVERLVFRPNISARAKYYSLCFLNQVILSHDEFKLANHLIMIYFSQFKLFVKEGEVDTKMMSALLTGVARAYPYAKLKDNIIMEQLDAMFRLVHMVSFNISVQALMLIFQVLDSKDSLSDRFYSALYRKLFDPAFSTSNRQATLLNLIYRSLKKDVAEVRVKAFVKRLLQVSLHQAPNLQCGILMLLSKVSQIHPNLLEFKHSYFSDSDSEEHYEDAPDEDSIKEQPEEMDTQTPTGSSWFHRQRTQKRSKSSYDFHSRNPLHAGAEYAGLWELLFLKQSFHPSVALFAQQVANSKEIKYSGDPLLDFTTSRFLDRFVYKNPKKQSEKLEQNLQARVFGSRKLKAASSKLQPINMSEYIQQNEKNIPSEEKFIYQYLQKRSTNTKKRKDEDSDIESVCSEDFQKLLDDIHPEDEGKDTLNFAKELGLLKQKKSKKRKAESESDDESLASLEDDDLDEEEVEFEGEDFDEEFGDLNDEIKNIDEDICEEDFIAFDEDIKKPTLHIKKQKKIESLTDANLLASAEEFSALLEDNANSKIDTTTANAFVNKDKSEAKQIAWEMNRHRYVKGMKYQKKQKGTFRKKYKK